MVGAKEKLACLDSLSIILRIAEMCLQIVRTPLLADMGNGKPLSDSYTLYSDISFLSCIFAVPTLLLRLERHFSFVLNSPFSISL